MVQPSGASEAPPEPEPQTNGTSVTSSSAPAPALVPAPNAPQSKKTLEKVHQPKPAKSKGYAFLFKYVLVGDSGVGKSALLARFTKDHFQEQHIYTIGVDFDIKTMDLPNGDEVKLQIWDTAGQERFRTITNSYYRGSNAVIVVYDVTDEKSFESLPRWAMEAQRFCNEDAFIVIIGTKTDMKAEGKKIYDREKATQLLKDDGFMAQKEASTDSADVFAVYEVSAKTGEGVEEAFREVTDQLVARRLNERNPLRGGKVTKVSTFGPGNTVQLGDKKPKSKCC